MTSEYKPDGHYGAPFTSEQCKASVYHEIPAGFHQCRRKPWRDGWCKQHHPDTVANRRTQSNLRAQHRWGARGKTQVVKAEMASQLREAREEIARLKARIAELERKQP